MSKSRLRPLKFKIIFTIAILIAAASIGFYYYSFRNAVKSNKEVEKKQVELIKQNLVTSARTYLISHDSLEFDNTLAIIKQDNDLLFFAVNDSSGKIWKKFNYYLVPANVASQTKKSSSYINEKDSLITVVAPIMYNDKKIGNVSFGLLRVKFIRANKIAQREFAFIGTAVFVCGLLLTIFISYLITRPFYSILKSTKKIVGGDYGHRIKTKRKDEFFLIANSFNSITERLEEANSQVIHLNKQLKTAYRDRLGELNLEINQRRLAEASLKKSEEQFRLLFNIAPIGMVITSPDRSIIKANIAFGRTLGYIEKELEGMTTLDLTYYEDRATDEEIYKDLLEGKIENRHYEKRYVTKKGNTIDVVNRVILYRNEKGKAIQFIEQVIDITEQNKMQRDLLIAKEKAEESDMMKSAFLAQMSHEIRTPLNVILAASSIFEEEVREHLDEDSQQVVDSVKSAGKRLMRTIDLILNMSAVQTGKYEPQFETLMLNDELRNLVEEFRPLCLEKNLKLKFQTHLDGAQIKVDKYTFDQIFQNLISNAIKYTKQGQVDVVVFKTDKIFVEIKDTGIGMSKEYLANLFIPFSQEVVGQKREFEGNGLGLALVKKYVEINHASIKVESEQNFGSTFTVIFDN